MALPGAGSDSDAGAGAPPARNLGGRHPTAGVVGWARGGLHAARARGGGVFGRHINAALHGWQQDLEYSVCVVIRCLITIISGSRYDLPARTMADFPLRDLKGYGRKPPTVVWPGNARVAVQIVLNYEVSHTPPLGCTATCTAAGHPAAPPICAARHPGGSQPVSPLRLVTPLQHTCARATSPPPPPPPPRHDTARHGTHQRERTRTNGTTTVAAALLLDVVGAGWGLACCGSGVPGRARGLFAAP